MMKEADIRPVDLMAENDRLHELDVEQLLARRSEFVDVPCPACLSHDSQPAFEKKGFTFVTCRSCETLFINPRPSPRMVAEFYAHCRYLSHWNDHIFPLTEETRRSQIFSPRAKRVIELCTAHGAKNQKLLDVGAGYGTFCEEVAKEGYFEEIIAVEPSESLAATCVKKGLQVINQPIEATTIEAVSVITNFELIEHLFNPLDFLLECARLLEKGGLLILTTPNIKGFDLLSLGALSENIAGPEHLNYFHPDSLAALLGRAGFELVETQTPGMLDAELVRSKMLSGALDAFAHPFLRRVLIEDWDMLGTPFQRFLVENKLSSHLWVVAKRQ